MKTVTSLCTSILVTVALCSGCTTWSLQRNTLVQSGSTSDLRYREIMENLALIAANPAALPAYTSIYAGTTDVNDLVSASSNSNWIRSLLKPSGSTTRFSTEVLDLPASRALKQNWTLDPTIIPEKLQAMRGACRWVMFGPERLGTDYAVLKRFEQGDPPGYYFDLADRLAGIKPGWIHVGCASDVPWHVCYKSSCRGKHIWVCQADMENLSAFSILIQSVARVELTSVYFPRVETRTISAEVTDSSLGKLQVTLTVDQNGMLTPGAGLPAVAIKARYDNVGKYADLKSIINASAKSP